MDNMQSGINAILENPEMMQKIMSLAQSLNAPATPEPQPEQPVSAPFPDLDLGMLQKLSGLASKASVDNNQQTLLSALRPYLSGDRIGRLERAMRAAKLAGLASSLLGNSGGLF